MSKCPFCELEEMPGILTCGHKTFGCGTVELPGDEYAQSPGCIQIIELREKPSSCPIDF